MTLLVPELLPTKGYPFATVRQLLADTGIQEGVVALGDLAVTQRAAGANMSVDVAAGAAWVQGDDVVRQGIYHLINDGTVNVPIGAAHATLPRLDQVVARIYDSSVIGASDVPALEVIAGTPTSGATLDNRTGAAALPNGAVRLADVLVGAADTSITTAEIRDRRRWAHGVEVYASSALGYSVPGSPTNIDTTNLYPRIECTGGLLEVLFSTGAANTHATNEDRLIASVIVDGVEQLRRSEPIHPNQIDGVTFHYIIQPAAGSHRIGINVSHDGAGVVAIPGHASENPRLTIRALSNRPNTI